VALPVPPSSRFSGGKAPVTPSSTPLGDDVARQPFVGAQNQKVAATAASAIPSTELQGQGMQAQCAFLLIHLTKELDTVSRACLDDKHHPDLI
jgi:hypothetical protein